MNTSRLVRIAALAALVTLATGCGGGSGAGGGGGGSAATSPAISTQPASIGVVAGQTASFSITATGSAPLAYQWARGGADIAGATSASYTTAATTLSDNGASFTARITNSAGSVTSSAAILTVTAATAGPVITTQPASQTVVAGQTVTFSVVATGTGLTYQWSRAGVQIAGATAATFTLSATALADNAATFQVRVVNGGGQVDSATATLTVTSPPMGTSPTAQRLSTGPGYTLARLADGTVIAWGSGMAGGSGPTYPGSNAHRISGLANIAAVVGFNTWTGTRPVFGDSTLHSLAVTADGTVYSWGWDFGATSDTPTFQLADTPVAVTRLGASKQVVTNRLLTLALHADGTVWYTPGTLRINPPSSNARQVTGLPNITALAEMHNQQNVAAAIGSDGTVWRLLATSANTGPGVTDWTVSAQQMPAPPGVVQATCAGLDVTISPLLLNTHYCLAVTSDGRVWSWGNNAVGQLGDGTQTERNAPAAIAGLSDMRKVLATGGMSYALGNDGRVYSWGGYGDNAGAALSARLPANSMGIDASLLTPGVVPGIQDIVELSGAAGEVRPEARAAGVHIAALKRDGTVWTWGADCCLQLGQSSATVSSSVPLQVPGVNLGAQ
jgi:alpha-tubulin suppressor-like RCC1 family protein